MAVSETIVNETAEMGFDGIAYTVSADVPALVCASCNAKFVDVRADRIMRQALREQIGLLQPEEIVLLRKQRGLTQQDVADVTGIAATTISRWEQGHAIQSLASNDHLRRFFNDVPSVVTVVSVDVPAFQGNAIWLCPAGDEQTAQFWYESAVWLTAETTISANTQYSLAA